MPFANVHSTESYFELRYALLKNIDVKVKFLRSMGNCVETVCQVFLKKGASGKPLCRLRIESAQAAF